MRLRISSRDSQLAAAFFGRVPGLQDRLIRRILPTGFPDATMLAPFFPQFAKAQKKKGVGTGSPTP
ncbi:hypothetical protein KB879_12175 [Cupriavidus sp. KK10]|uniref:hypothetical protein n=1 Tax=Cupriavidus sp. KK10 TaxID=1478019 RepID=UPI001BAC4338|nr:hypothetical protein [Cupriavidus sp. KK10]QUN30599.1 hypothetical protein KB879_12175 [Cupriavidus sp. KK10]